MSVKLGNFEEETRKHGDIKILLTFNFNCKSNLCRITV